MWAWTPKEHLDNESITVAPEDRCPAFIAIVIRRRGNSYDAEVALVLAVCAIPIHNSDQQELQVIRRRIRRTQPSPTDVLG